LANKAHKKSKETYAQQFIERIKRFLPSQYSGAASALTQKEHFIFLSPRRYFLFSAPGVIRITHSSRAAHIHIYLRHPHPKKRSSCRRVSWTLAN